MNTHLREEFEKAFIEQWNILEPNQARLEEAIWAAKWMAERCADLTDHEVSTRVGDMIRQLAKGLDQ